MARKPFGGMKIRPDAALAAVIGSGDKSPSEMTKAMWSYVKRKGLLGKGGGKAFGGLVIKADAALAAVVGSGAKAPSAVTKALWAYIKRKGLMKKG